MVNGALIKQVCGNNLLDDLLQDLLAELLGGDLLSVLSGHDNRVDTERDCSTAIFLVLNGDLSLRVGTEPREDARAASNSHRFVQAVGENERERHVLRRLVRCIAEHDTLVTGTDVLERAVVKSLGDIRRLLLDRDKNVTGLVVESLRGVVIPDLLDGFTDNLLVVDLPLRGNFTEDHDHAGFGGSLASDLREGVLCQTGIELCTSSLGPLYVVTEYNTDDSIRDLVANLICTTVQ